MFTRPATVILRRRRIVQVIVGRRRDGQVIAANDGRVRTRVVHVARGRNPVVGRRHTQAGQFVQIVLRYGHHIGRRRRGILHVEIVGSAEQGESC